MNALTVEQVERLQRALIQRFGGTAGLRDAGALQSALARPFAAFGGVEAFASVADKVAALFHGLVTSHAFVDGNKRVGLAATLIWLELRGRRLALTPEQRYTLTVRVAEGRLTTDGLAAVLRDVID